MIGVTRVAAIDCGTNSIRLLIADVDPATGTLTDVLRRMEVVRLGQGVDRTGQINPEALQRALEMTREYADLITAQGAARTRFVATSATRDASNRQDFVDGVRDILGVPPEVLAGAQEAELSFQGAKSVLHPSEPGPFLIVDLGGGSTELVRGTTVPEASVSMDVGCVRMTERHLGFGQPTDEQIAAAQADVRSALDAAAAEVDLGNVGTLIGLAGTVTTVTAHALNLPRYDREQINGSHLPVGEVLSSCADLMRMPREQREALGFMHPGRVDVISAGALVWAEVVARVQAEVAAAGGELTDVLTSEHDILDGIALSLAAEN